MVPANNCAGVYAVQHCHDKPQPLSSALTITPVSYAADTKAWEVDTLRGHVNNVSCVLFHARSVCISLPPAPPAVLPLARCITCGCIGRAAYSLLETPPAWPAESAFSRIPMQEAHAADI